MTLIEVVVVFAFVLLLAFLVMSGVPSTGDKRKAMRASCQNNLKQIGIAFRTWASDHNGKYPMDVSTNNGGSMEWLAGGNMFKHFQVMSNELNNPKILLCPSDDRDLPANYDFANLRNNNLSYFVGLDADETLPAMILSGDRNLVTNGVDAVPGLVVVTTKTTVGWSATMHKFAGNFGLADGSVQQGTGAGLQTYFSRTGTNINRLAVP
jgi:type II secretory pathway pseudopilin PulG